MEHRFVLIDFTSPTATGKPKLYEAGCSYPMPAALAHAAAKRDLVAHHKPPHWFLPSILAVPVALTVLDVQEAESELAALERHAGNLNVVPDA